MRTTLSALFVVVVVLLWAVTALAATAIWRAVDRGQRPTSDLAGALSGLAACSAGVVVVFTAGAV